MVGRFSYTAVSFAFLRGAAEREFERESRG